MTRNLYRSVRTQMFAFGAVLAVSAFLFGCSQPTSAPNSVARISATLPTANGHAIVDIPTPSFNGNTVSAGTTSGHMVCLTWQSNSPDNTTFDYSTGLDPTSPTTLNGSYGWEYWGCTQRSIVSSPHYSGHYELTRLNPDNTTTNLGDITADAFCDDNLADGTYTYYLKAKSLEGSTPNQMTHHSATSAGYSVTVTSCVDDGWGTVAGVTPYVINIHGVWSGNGSANWVSGVWTDGANCSIDNNRNIQGKVTYNIAFNVDSSYYVHNSCTGYSYTTAAVTGNLWFRVDGGSWIAITGTTYTLIHPYYEINGTMMGSPSQGTHLIEYTNNTANGALGAFHIFFVH